MATTFGQQMQPQHNSSFAPQHRAANSNPSPPYYNYDIPSEVRGNCGQQLTFEQSRNYRPFYVASSTPYLPAALRPKDYKPPSSTTQPTTIPPRPNLPDTPPASKGNSFDSASSNKSTKPALTPSPPYVAPYNTYNHYSDLAGLADRLQYCPEPPPSPVCAPPATSHWKPDLTSPSCALCGATFTWYFRRHHCRKCGFVVCGEHSLNKVPLDQNAHFHPDGFMSRACDSCYKEWKHDFAGLASEDGSLSATPRVEVPGQLADAGLLPPVTTQGAEPRSLGVYGNWSTF